MIEVVIAVCLISEPNRCKDVSLPFMEQHVTPYACHLYGQSEIAKWLAAHPGWEPKRWTCRRAKLEAKA